MSRRNWMDGGVVWDGDLEATLKATAMAIVCRFMARFPKKRQQLMSVGWGWVP